MSIAQLSLHSQAAPARRAHPARLSARQRCWRLIALLAVVDALLLVAASRTVAPHPSPRQLFRARLAETAQTDSRRVLSAGFQREVLHALLYRADGQVDNSLQYQPPCTDTALTYGQIDTCGDG